jgi:hypothetical protein
MNSFHLGRMCCQGRFVDNSLQIQKGEVRFARRKRPLLHFRIHENWLLIVSVGAGSLPLRFAEEKAKKPYWPPRRITPMNADNTTGLQAAAYGKGGSGKCGIEIAISSRVRI